MNLIRLSVFAAMLCKYNSHYDPTGGKGIEGTVKYACRVKNCRSRMGKAASTLRLMAKDGRLLGAVKYGSEWLVDPARAAKSVFNGRGAPKKKEKMASRTETHYCQKCLEKTQHEVTVEADGRALIINRVCKQCERESITRA